MSVMITNKELQNLFSKVISLKHFEQTFNIMIKFEIQINYIGTNLLIYDPRFL